jgi:hypothetical protein
MFDVDVYVRLRVVCERAYLLSVHTVQRRPSEPSEWPTAPAAKRDDLLRELATLIEELDPKRPRTLVAQLDLGPDRALFDQGRAVLTIARMLLGGPCPYRELAIVGLLHWPVPSAAQCAATG